MKRLGILFIGIGFSLPVLAAEHDAAATGRGVPRSPLRPVPGLTNFAVPTPAPTPAAARFMSPGPRPIAGETSSSGSTLAGKGAEPTSIVDEWRATIEEAGDVVQATLALEILEEVEKVRRRLKEERELTTPYEDTFLGLTKVTEFPFRRRLKEANRLRGVTKPHPADIKVLLGEFSADFSAKYAAKTRATLTLESLAAELEYDLDGQIGTSGEAVAYDGFFAHARSSVETMRASLAARDRDLVAAHARIADLERQLADAEAYRTAATALLGETRVEAQRAYATAFDAKATMLMEQADRHLDAKRGLATLPGRELRYGSMREPLLSGQAAKGSSRARGRTSSSVVSTSAVEPGDSTTAVELLKRKALANSERATALQSQALTPPDKLVAQRLADASFRPASFRLAHSPIRIRSSASEAATAAVHEGADSGVQAPHKQIKRKPGI